VTVDGNQKFAGKSLIKIHTPLCKDLLSHRLLIFNHKSGVLSSDTSTFDLRQLTAGVPATWADADILRSNHCPVYEHGELNDILIALGKGKCDYVALGANEINAIFNEFKCAERGLVIDPHHIIHYPLPLVFYVNPARADVAHWLTVGLNSAMQSGAFDKLFNEHFPGAFAKLNIKQRRLHRFSNPYLA
jgi:ABC-type amino acid transport substrate-binding protein